MARLIRCDHCGEISDQPADLKRGRVHVENAHFQLLLTSDLCGPCIGELKRWLQTASEDR